MKHTVSEDYIGHSAKAVDKVGMTSDLIRAISWVLDGNTDHCDQDRCKNTDKSCNLCQHHYPVLLINSRASLQAIASHDTFFIVRGRDNMNESINPTTPKTIEQVPCSVKVFIITVKVKR